MVEDDVRELFGETVNHFSHEILALEIADDHVHLFVQTDPKYSPADIARQFKSYSGKHLLERYPNIRESYFWGDGFWKVGYYVGTTGAVSEEWLNGISRRQNIKSSVGLHPRPRWVGELALEGCLKKGEVGKPLACSGHVSTDVWEYLPTDAEEELLQNRISGARFHLGGPDSPAYPFYKTTDISHVIDRVGLDKRLTQRAVKAGAELRDHHTVTAVDEQPDQVVVTAATPAGNQTTIAGRMVAGCDGPTSRVRQSVGLDAPTEQLHGVLAFSTEADAGDRVDVHLTAPTFFAWRIPRGAAGVEYGVAAPPGTAVTDQFTALTHAYDVETDRSCSGVIPIGPPDSVTTDRVFLIGDAAAQTKPFTGGGILYSMTAADIAAATIDPTAPHSLATYETEWRAELGTEIQLGSAIRRCYSLPAPVQRLRLRALSGKIGAHMDRPTSFFSKDHLRRIFSR